MENNNITLLLERYWKAETTLAEEKEIKSHFENNSTTAEAENLWYNAMSEFQKMDAAREEVSPGNEKKLLGRPALSPLFKIAAILLLCSGLLTFSLSYNRQRQLENDSAVRKIAETDLASIAELLQEGNAELKLSAQFLSDIKIQK